MLVKIRKLNVLRSWQHIYCTGELNLPAAAVTMEATKGKYIAVDDFQQTSSKGIYALGDVCGKVELTPVAIAAGRRLADR